MIRGPEELFDSAPRWAGIQRVAAEAGIRIDRRLVFQLPGIVDPISGFEGGLRFARQMLQSGRPFTAVLAFDDLTALGRGDAGYRKRACASPKIVPCWALTMYYRQMWQRRGSPRFGSH